MTKQFYLKHSDVIDAIGISCNIEHTEDASCEIDCPLYAACLYRVWKDDSSFESSREEEFKR